MSSPRLFPLIVAGLMALPTLAMEGPRSDPYDVLLVKKDGKTSVFKHYD